MIDIVRCESVSLAIGREPVLSGFDIAVKAGEVVAMTGPSGSGKTTCLNVIAGLIRPTSGSVSFNGLKIDAISDARRSAIRLKHMGIVPQSNDLIPELTLGENVALPLMLMGVAKRAAVEQAEAKLRGLGLEHVAGKTPAEVSGGQAQRAAVARALVHRPEVILADEPTGALDRGNASAVMDLVVRAAREAGAAAIVVTHDSAIAQKCDRVVSIGSALPPDGVACD